MFDSVGDRDIPLIGYVKLFGLLCVTFGAIELGVGAWAYTWLDSYYFAYGYGFGAWWATVMVVLAGLCTCCSASCKGGIIAAAIFGTAGFATALIGAIWDTTAAKYFNSFQACMVLPQGNDDLVMVYWGNPGYFPDVQRCMGRGNDDNLWIPSLIGPSGGKRGQCVCVPFNLKCQQFRLSASTMKSGQNCGNILDNYTYTLISSASKIFSHRSSFKTLSNISHQYSLSTHPINCLVNTPYQTESCSYVYYALILFATFAVFYFANTAFTCLCTALSH